MNKEDAAYTFLNLDMPKSTVVFQTHTKITKTTYCY